METETALAISCGTVAATWAVRGRSSAVFAPSVWHGPRDSRAVALTFDDGPGESTPVLLDLLAELGVPATFFQVGRHAERLPEIARRVSAAGHEIGNHTHDHAPLWLRSPAFVAAQVARAQGTLEAVHGAAPRWFRAPYGVRWFGLRAAQRANGLLGVMWSTIGRDWALPGPAVARRLLHGIAPGAIFCLHDGRELAPRPDIRATIDAVRIAAPEIKARGYRFVTLSQLLCPTNSHNA